MYYSMFIVQIQLALELNVYNNSLVCIIPDTTQSVFLIAQIQLLRTLCSLHEK